MAKQNSSDFKDPEWNPVACKYKHKLINNNIQDIHDNIQEIKSLIEEQKDKFKISEEAINTKIDQFDQSFRGNGKIGVFEQIRSVKKWIYVCFGLILLLLGGRFSGLTLDNVLKVFQKDKPETTIVKEGNKVENIEDKTERDIKEGIIRSN